jgi:mono/diheme cytochrome c family protein
MNPDRKKGAAKHAREVHPPARSHAEDPEPSTASHGLPVWIFVALAIGLFMAMVYLDNHAGGFSPVVYKPYVSSNELAGLVPMDPSQKDFFTGMKVYNRPTCNVCHGANGQGTSVNPPLAGSEWVLESDPSRIIRIVLDGLTGPIQVKGQAFGTGQMLPLRDSLNDEEIAQVLTYVRKEWGNKASAVKTEQVAAVREATKAHAGKNWTAEELMQVQLKQ